jgi:hypothetical protein
MLDPSDLVVIKEHRSGLLTGDGCGTLLGKNWGNGRGSGEFYHPRVAATGNAECWGKDPYGKHILWDLQELLHQISKKGALNHDTLSC